MDLVTLVPTWASSGHGSTAWPAGWPHLDLVTLVPTWVSSGQGSSAWPAVWPHLDVESRVATWASPMLGDTGTTWASLGPGESGPYLVLTRNWQVWSPPGSHLDLVNLVPIWASPSPCDFVPHLDLIVVDTFLASPGSGESDPNLASSRSGDSGPHLWTIMTWISVLHLRLTWT